MAVKQGESPLSLTTTVGLAMAIIAVFIAKDHLTSSRPVGTASDIKSLLPNNKVSARLWEDPFEAVQEKIRAAKRQQVTADAYLHKGNGIENVFLQINLGDRPDLGDLTIDTLKEGIKREVKKARQTLVLMTTTVGGSYPESRESRIRDRYAVGSALGVACYVLKEEGGLRVVTYELQQSLSTAVIPYEQYVVNSMRRCGDVSQNVLTATTISNTEQRYDSVFVLWIKNDDLGDSPVLTLRRLVCALSDQIDNPEGCRNAKLDFVLLGPRSSSEMERFLKNAVKQETPHTAWLTLYSPWATAMPELFLREMYKQSPYSFCKYTSHCESIVANALKYRGLELAYQIPSDDVLFEAIIRELTNNRKINVGEEDVVLIGEWDTFYGRALPIEFRAVACAHIAKKKNQQHPGLAHRCDTTTRAVQFVVEEYGNYLDSNQRIYRYSYLRELDGRDIDKEHQDLKEGHRKSITHSPREADDGVELDIAKLERPEGGSQFDYVKRLAARIKLEHKDTRVVGILGTDPYDALLIMQALKEEFPDAVYFVTDVDARYLEPSETNWARNTLVASHFGLQLHEDIQRDIPPFRGSYQTSAFLATLKALGYVHDVKNAEKPTVGATFTDRLFSAKPGPRLYEIGTTKLVDISQIFPHELPQDKKPTIHPPRNDLDGEGRPNISLLRLLCIISVLCISIILIAISYGRLWHWIINVIRWHREHVLFAFVLWIAAFFFLAFSIIGFVDEYPNEEPLLGLTGTSIWPTEALRILAIILAIGMLLKGRADLIRSNRASAEIMSIEQLVSTERPGDRNFNIWASFTTWVKSFNMLWHDVRWIGDTFSEECSLNNLWSTYLHIESRRSNRVFVLFSAFIVLIIAFSCILEDQWGHPPCRGKISCALDGVVTFVSVLLMWVVSFTVFDSVLTCRQWLLALKHSIPAAEKGLSPDQRYTIIELVAVRTAVLNQRIRYPFILLVIMMVARNNLFDAWSIPQPLKVAWILNAILALLSAVLLYTAAQTTKNAILDQLREDGRGLQATQKWLSKTIKRTIEDIEAEKRGAFVPIWGQPSVQSTLLAALAVLQYYYLGR